MWNLIELIILVSIVVIPVCLIVYFNKPLINLEDIYDKTIWKDFKESVNNYNKNTKRLWKIH